MKKTRMLYTILFCLWIGINYFGIWADAAQRMAENLSDRDNPIYLSTFQVWFFRILSQVLDAVFVAVATGIFAYHYRYLKASRYVALALLVRYFTVLLLLPFALWKHSLSEVITSIRETAPTHELIVGGLIQLSLVVFAAFVGVSYGRHADYLDDRDETLGFLGGVSKKVWALLMILFNPVARFVGELSLVFMYKFSRDVASAAYWKATVSNPSDSSASGGVFGLIFNFLLVWLLCATGFAIFYFGVQTVRNRDAKYRWLKIMAIYAALPAVIVVIPLVRNRTWFF